VWELQPTPIQDHLGTLKADHLQQFLDSCADGPD